MGVLLRPLRQFRWLRVDMVRVRDLHDGGRPDAPHLNGTRTHTSCGGGRDAAHGMQTTTRIKVSLGHPWRLLAAWEEGRGGSKASCSSRVCFVAVSRHVRGMWSHAATSATTVTSTSSLPGVGDRTSQATTRVVRTALVPPVFSGLGRLYWRLTTHAPSLHHTLMVG